MVGKQESALAWLKDAFSLDTRSLGAFRIGLGLLLILDILDRFPDISSHYTDQGLFPREILDHSLWNLGWHYSLHSLSGGGVWQIILFIVAAITAFLLAIGWKTRWVTLISWILLCSLHARNSAVLHGGDALMRMLLFFSIFLPLGARFSLDSIKLKVAPDRIINAASIGVFMQVAAVYQFSLFFKTDPMWRETFDALYYTLNYDFIAKPLAGWLTQWPSLLRSLTILTLAIEALGPVLLFVSCRRPWLRITVIASFLLFHGIIWSTIAIGSFSFVCMLAWILFIPSALWTRFSASHENHLRPSFYGKKISQILPAAGIILILIWNSLLLDKEAKAESLPGWLKTAVRTPMLNQRWMAFSNEKGLRWSGWMVIEGTTQIGERYDLIDGRNLTKEPKPQSLHDRLPSERWRKGIRLYLSCDATVEDRRRLSQFFATQWNRDNPNHHIIQPRILYYVQWINEPGSTPARGPSREFVFFDGNNP